MIKEPCYFHPETPAEKWRRKMNLGEPDRVPLCAACIKDLKDAWPPVLVSLFPLKEKHVKQAPFEED